jgi:hypothetical protein
VLEQAGPEVSEVPQALVAAVQLSLWAARQQPAWLQPGEEQDAPVEQAAQRRSAVAW